MKTKFTLVIDLERCIGCEACTVACRLENKGVQGWIRVETIDAADKDVPSGRFPDLSMVFVPKVCNHCENPPCADACPLEAIQKQENGIVMLQQEICDGCRSCLDACPYGAIIFDGTTQKAQKCNLCIHRTGNNLEPFCVICCEGQAMHFGDLNDSTNLATKLAASQNAFQLKPEAGTGPRVYYCPPKPPRGL